MAQASSYRFNMRGLSVFFYGLAALAAICWGLGYVYLSGLACAFGSVNGPCRTPAPWNLDNESFVFMVVAPAMVVSVLVLAGWAFGRKAG